METFLKMGNKMVLAVPWMVDFDANAMQTTKAPVWIDLPMLNPIFDYYSNQLLVKVGMVIYGQTTTTRSRFPHIHGCILCNLNKDLIDYIAIKIPGIGEFKVDVIYMTLPDACFA